MENKKRMAHEILLEWFPSVNDICHSAQEEKELVRRIQQNDKDALNQFVQGYLKDIPDFVSRFSMVPFIEVEQLMEDALVELVSQAKKYTSDCETSFSTFMKPNLSIAVLNSFSEQLGTKNCDQKDVEGMVQFFMKWNQLEDIYGRSLTYVELQEELGKEITLFDGTYLFDQKLFLNDSSTVEISGLSLEEYNMEDEIVDLVFHEEFNEFLKKQVNPFQYEIMKLRYGLVGEEEHTLREVGDKMGYSSTKIRYNHQQVLNNFQKSRFIHPFIVGLGYDDLDDYYNTYLMKRQRIADLQMKIYRKEEVEKTINSYERELLSLTDWVQSSMFGNGTTVGDRGFPFNYYIFNVVKDYNQVDVKESICCLSYPEKRLLETSIADPTSSFVGADLKSFNRGICILDALLNSRVASKNLQYKKVESGRRNS